MNLLGPRQVIAAGILISVAFVGLGCSTTQASAPVSGVELYGACISCHGPAGEGNAAVGAPRIAGMPQWYIASQLQRFQDGLRGKHPDDHDGLRMRAMARQMMSAGEISTVAEYVSGLPPITNPPTLHDGRAEAGEAIFARCTACHGAQGQGTEAVHAPPLAGLDDWYVERQLRKFQAGVRGKAQGDAIGPVMQAMSLSLQPQDIADVAAYVHALPR